MYDWYSPDDYLPELAKAVSDGRRKSLTWACINYDHVAVGDRAYFVRVRKPPKGVFASGFITGKVSQESREVRIRPDVLRDPETQPILRLDRFKSQKAFQGQLWTAQSSGIRIKDAQARALDTLWRAFLREEEIALPEEMEVVPSLMEGATRQIRVNAYERNREARRKCLDHYGTTCVVCKKDLGDVYGEIGRGIIHVHHVTPMASIGRRYVIDPIQDLHPVCPNCHAIIHSKTPPFETGEVEDMLKRR